MNKSKREPMTDEDKEARILSMVSYIMFEAKPAAEQYRLKGKSPKESLKASALISRISYWLWESCQFDSLRRARDFAESCIGLTAMQIGHRLVEDEKFKFLKLGDEDKAEIEINLVQFFDPIEWRTDEEIREKAHESLVRLHTALEQTDYTDLYKLVCFEYVCRLVPKASRQEVDNLVNREIERLSTLPKPDPVAWFQDLSNRMDTF